jgi:hypothetical protein
MSFSSYMEIVPPNHSKSQRHVQLRIQVPTSTRPRTRRFERSDRSLVRGVHSVTYYWNEMEDRSSVFNNAGVDVLQSNPTKNLSVAMDFFLAALESKLAFERHQFATTADDASPVLATKGAVSGISSKAACLVQAELHLENLTTFLSPSTTSALEEDTSVLRQAPPNTVPSVVFVDPATTASSHMGRISVPVQCRGYNPYLFTSPFRFSSDTQAGSFAIAPLNSSFIVFNLGLVHQLMDRTSPKASSMYEISATLLASVPESPETLRLCLALYNNFGVWCFENGIGEAMRECMELLSLALDKEEQEDGSVSWTKEDSQAMRSNIDWLLTPPNGGSPAA